MTKKMLTQFELKTKKKGCQLISQHLCFSRITSLFHKKKHLDVTALLESRSDCSIREYSNCQGENQFQKGVFVTPLHAPL